MNVLCLDDADDYKYNKERKIKRSYISDYILCNLRYERQSMYHTKPYDNDIYWEDENHLCEEIEKYENEFYKVVNSNNEAVINRIECPNVRHIENDTERCCCPLCVVKAKLKRIVNDNSTVFSLGGEEYSQTFDGNYPKIRIIEGKYYNVVTNRSMADDVCIPMTEFIDTIT